MENIPFGAADITIGEGADAEVIKFDGKENLQHEGGEITITPMFADFTSVDFGESIYDKRVTGYEVTVSFTAMEEKIKNIQLALSATATVTNDNGDVIGITDAKLGTSMRAKAKKVRIHPRVMGNDDSLDIVVYKMASTGEYTRAYANEQGNIGISFEAFPKDGLDASQDGNFFYIGQEASDPVGSQSIQTEPTDY